MKSVHITELLQLNLIEVASRISAGVGVERGADSGSYWLFQSRELHDYLSKTYPSMGPEFCHTAAN